MRVFKQGGGWYLTQNLPFNKQFEIGYQWERFFEFDLMLHLTSQQDHQGVFFWIQLWLFFFECSIRDTRHWNYDAKRFYLPGEEEAERALATMSASAWKDVPAYTQAIDACMPKEEAK